MGNAQSEEKKKKPKPIIITRPYPKRLLWGCTTSDEHYNTIDEYCKIVSEEHGLAGLHKIGFDYQVVHVQNPCPYCLDIDTNNTNSITRCNIIEQESLSSNSSSGGSSNGEEEEEEYSNNNNQEEENNKVLSREDDSCLHIDEEKKDEHEVYMVPLGAPLQRRNSKKFQSTTSLFSLATHHSRATTNSIMSSSINNSEGEQQDCCTPRLFHMRSGGTMITERNFLTYITNGKMYDEVARLCMEYAQDCMIQEGNLEWQTLCPTRQIKALVSKSNNNDNDDTATTKSTLLIITGKGKVGAGIFSRRLLLTVGLEPASAISFVREAKQRDINRVIILDPNSMSSNNNKMIVNAMDVVETSLQKLVFDDINKNNNQLYVLAHSMAGSQLVRFLLEEAKNTTTTTIGDITKNTTTTNNNQRRSIINKSKCNTTTTTTNATAVANNSNQIEDTTNSSYHLNCIQAIAFTDSNHNLQWCKNYRSLIDFFVGPKCLYIKSQTVHDNVQRAAGETMDNKGHTYEYWKHRFGMIRTIYAGTKEHSLTNHTARHHIWQHFDSTSTHSCKSDNHNNDYFTTIVG